MPTIPAGTYRIGTNTMDGFAEDLEGPQISLDSPAFAIDATTVTNQAFQVFVEATGYVTEAERFGWSFVFHYFLSEQTKHRSQKIPNMAWWYTVSGADWRHLKDLIQRLPSGWITQWFRCLATMRSPIANGQKNASRQKQSGRSLQKAGQLLKNILGEGNFWQKIPIIAIFGKASFQKATREQTASPIQRLRNGMSPMALVSIK